MRSTRETTLAATAAFLMLLLSCGGEETGASSREDGRSDPAVAASTPLDARLADGPTHASMRHVLFHLEQDIVLDIDWLEGELRPAVDSVPVIFDDPTTFSLYIDSGVVALSMTSLERLMNDWVFAYDDAPLQDLEFEVKDGQLRLHGKLDKLINVPFEIDASPSMTAKGEIRIRPSRMSTGGFIGNAIRKLLGLDLEEAVDLDEAQGVRAEGNDLYLDPNRLLPPPRIDGNIAAIEIRDGKLVQYFGPDTNANVQAPAEESFDRNFMHFTGGTLGFGKLRMIDADLRVIDMDADDPFDFSLAEYQAQLIAGMSRTTEQLGLDVFMPDLDELRSRKDGGR